MDGAPRKSASRKSAPQRRSDSAQRRAAPRSGFDFTARIRDICADMVARLDELSHIDISRVAVSFAQVRNAAPHGVLATLTPLRFEAGATTTIRRGRRYSAQRLVDATGRELLYIVRFYLPRFQNYSLDEKVATIVHELWHISPRFDGDLRRFPGRCYAHGPSTADYEEEVKVLARRWLEQDPPPALYDFLHQSFAELQRTHGTIHGLKIATPKLIPLPR